MSILGSDKIELLRDIFYPKNIQNQFLIGTLGESESKRHFYHITLHCELAIF